MNVPPISEFDHTAYPAPDWLRQAVIAEVPIRAFNHPEIARPQQWQNSFGHASYLSILERLPLLKSLGVNVLCLYSIYDHTPGTNLYAIRHHEPAYELGSIEQLSTFIDSAHTLGFKIISNTNHYGCAENSPMVSEHPDWFLPPAFDLYGQRIFDLSHPEVVPYIISTHVWWCTEIGLDGWRIDIAHETYRDYIWDEILKQCHEAGKPILLATEGAHLQGHARGAGWNDFPISRDMTDPQAGWSSRDAPYGTLGDYLAPTKEDPYRTKDISSHNSTVPCPHNFFPDTCARNGAYQIQGSRFLFGHNLMFAPFVPWMMSGDLINATHLGVPGVLSHRLRGKLLHAYIDWRELDQKQAVIADFQRIAAIRSKHSDLFHNNRFDTHLINLRHTAVPTSSAKPYIRFLPGEKAAIILGNERHDKSLSLAFTLPLESLGFKPDAQLRVEDAWNNHTSTLKQATDSLKVVIPPDLTPGGGIGVLIIERAEH